MLSSLTHRILFVLDRKRIKHLEISEVPGFLFLVTTLRCLTPFAFFHQDSTAIFGLLRHLLSRCSILIIGRYRLNLVHVRDGGLQVGIRPKLFFGHAEQLTHIDGLTCVAIDHAKETLCRDAVVLRRIVLLALVAGHFSPHIVQF